MATQSQIPDAAKKALGGMGKKLIAHEIHVRRTAEKGKYIAKHDLRDEHGQPPSDGQRDSAEYTINSPEELAGHMAQHMSDPSEEDQ